MSPARDDAASAAPTESQVFDLIIVGGGPCGLACAVAARRHGLSHLILEKGPFLNTLVRFPETMSFFSSAERLEIGGIPFALPHLRPTRAEGIAYFHKVAQREQVNLHTYEPVTEVTGRFGDFTVTTLDRTGRRRFYRSRAVVMATGYYDNPNLLGVPGEELDHVLHHYDQPYRYFRQRVVVIGAGNSAAQVALELFRHGAHVTLVHRGPSISDHVKPWIRPDLEARLRNNEIPAYFDTVVERIERDRVHLVQKGDRRFTLPADFVLAMTGYRADHSQLVKLGVNIDPVSGAPVYDPDTMETNVPGLYLAGVIAGGHEANILMIENGRFHGPKIAAHLARRLSRRSSKP
ncbi:MAG: YpdA family putative bacillithiol disulfide reductase [Firmicutes bacterium]|nr:YpdA family putative bacillithiol disulfide reductase [Bacillota bacterium]